MSQHRFLNEQFGASEDLRYKVYITNKNAPVMPPHAISLIENQLNSQTDNQQKTNLPHRPFLPHAFSLLFLNPTQSMGPTAQLSSFTFLSCAHFPFHSMDLYSHLIPKTE